jgi:hypothetical protein
MIRRRNRTRVIGGCWLRAPSAETRVEERSTRSRHAWRTLDASNEPQRSEALPLIDYWSTGRGTDNQSWLAVGSPAGSDGTVQSHVGLGSRGDELVPIAITGASDGATLTRPNRVEGCAARSARELVGLGRRPDAGHAAERPHRHAAAQTLETRIAKPLQKNAFHSAG